MTDQDQSLQAGVSSAAPELPGEADTGSVAAKGAEAVEKVGEVAQTAQRGCWGGGLHRRGGGTGLR